MKINKPVRTGFTLVELLLGVFLFSVFMALLLRIFNSFQNTGDIAVARQRMETIVKAMQTYYMARENLPLPVDAAGIPLTTSDEGQVPLDALDLDSKYNLDPWGRPFFYYSVRNDGANGRPGQILIDPLSAGAPAGSPTAMVDIPQADLTVTPATGKTLLTGVQITNVVNEPVINHKRLAGVLISFGPNGQADYTRTPGYPEQFTPNSGSDDILVPIDLTAQAVEIARKELQRLGRMVRAFDDRFMGKDNNGDGGYDEAGCASIGYPGAGIADTHIGPQNPAAPVTEAACNSFSAQLCANYFPDYPQAGYLPDDGNDYSCGSPTLDSMQANYCDISAGLGNCPYGYYVPNEHQYVHTYSWDAVAGCVRDTNTPYYCGYIGADYFRVPMDRGNPQPENCHWGLVGDPGYVFATGQANTVLANDQVRAFIFCAYGLAPEDIVDPWLNGYAWGCGTGNSQGGTPCAYEFPDTDSRAHRFYSAGADGMVGSDLDGDGMADDSDGDGIPDPGDDIVAPL